jgi:hypothetical protein
MIRLAYSCLLLGIPALSVSACLVLHGTPWPGRLLYVIPSILYVLFALLIARHATRRRLTHLVAGIILVPVMWLVTIVILAAILISPGSMDGIR